MMGSKAMFTGRVSAEPVVTPAPLTPLIVIPVVAKPVVLAPPIETSELWLETAPPAEAAECRWPLPLLGSV